MPKRKISGNRKQRSKKSRTTSPPKCLRLPQEVLDRIIEVSFNVDTVLGVLPDQVHQNFLNPFMRVNRACREHMIKQISSLTWIELRSLDHKHTPLVRRLASEISSIDQFWWPIVSRERTRGGITFDFGQTKARSTRRHVNENQSFLSPYSFSSMLRLVVGIGHAMVDLGTFRVEYKFPEMPQRQSDEINSLMSFLCPEVVTDSGFVDRRNFTISDAPPNNMNVIKEFISRIINVGEDLQEVEYITEDLRVGLIHLYMVRLLISKASKSLRQPCFWAPILLDGPHWRSNRYAVDWMDVIPKIQLFEAVACQAFQNLFETEPEWVTHRAPYLTDDYTRWIQEPVFTYFGVWDDMLIHYYHNVGTAITIYNEMQGLLEDSISNSALLDARLQKKIHAWTCALKLKPGIPNWHRDFRNAQIEQLKYFPQQGRAELMREYSFYHYTDVDGQERTWLENDLCPWDAKSLQYLHRARQLYPGSIRQDDQDADE